MGRKCGFVLWFPSHFPRATPRLGRHRHRHGHRFQTIVLG